MTTPSSEIIMLNVYKITETNVATVIDIRVAFMKLNGQTLLVQELMKELDSIKKMSQKFFPKELTAKDIYDVGRKVGWLTDTASGKIAIRLE